MPAPSWTWAAEPAAISSTWLSADSRSRASTLLPPLEPGTYLPLDGREAGLPNCSPARSGSSYPTFEAILRWVSTQSPACR